MSLDEYWKIFAQEGRESLAEIEKLALSLDAEPSNRDEIQGLYRTVHTFKGNARVMGVAQLERISHTLEDLIGLYRAESVAWHPRSSEFLLEFVDHGRKALEEAVAAQADLSPEFFGSFEGELKDFLNQLEAEEPCSPGVAPPIEEFMPIPPTGGAPASGLDAEAYDPALDPESVAIFFQLFEANLVALSEGLHALQRDPAGDAAELRGVLDRLLLASERMGYGRLSELLENTLEALDSSQPDPDFDFSQVEFSVFEELVLIQEAVRTLCKDAASNLPDFSAPFRSWHAERFLVDIAKVTEILEGLPAGPDSREAQETAAREMAPLLEAMHHACLSYGLDEVSQVMLGFSELNERALQGEVDLGLRLFECIGQFARDLGGHLGGLDGEESAQKLREGLQSSREFLARVARGELDPQAETPEIDLEIPAALLQTLTPEIRERLHRRFLLKDRFYLVAAPLEVDEGLAQRFLEWLESDQVHSITNSCIPSGGVLIYHYLVSSPKDSAAFLEEAKFLDPEQGRVEVRRVASKTDPGPSKKLSLSSAEAGPALSEDSPEDEGERALEASPGPRENFLRIDAEKIGKMMELSGEIALAAGAIWHHPDLGGEQLEFLRAGFERLNAVVRELQELAGNLRLIPIGGLFDRLRRLVHDLSKSTGKPVRIHFEGEELEVDKVVVDHLFEPLLHLVRNAVDHGLENPARRLEVGKPEAGSIRVVAKHQDSGVLLTLEDDGQGIDVGAIREKAKRLGLVDAETSQDSKQLLEWITLPGFTTKEEVSAISGRGVGLDAVKAVVEGLRGTFSLESEAGLGTKILIHLPVTVAFLDAMVVRIQETLYAVSLLAVERVLQVSAETYVRVSAEQRDVLQLEGESIPVCRLGRGEERASEASSELVGQLVLVAGSSRGKVAIPVDEVLGTQQISMKPLARFLQAVKSVSGCALLPSGQVALVLDPERLIEFV